MQHAGRRRIEDIDRATRRGGAEGRVAGKGEQGVDRLSPPPTLARPRSSGGGAEGGGKTYPWQTPHNRTLDERLADLARHERLLGRAGGGVGGAGAGGEGVVVEGGELVGAVEQREGDGGDEVPGVVREVELGS